MADSDGAAFQEYWATILRAGTASTREELLTLVNISMEALDEGALATMRLLVDGTIQMENAFTTLDCAKSLATKYLSIRAAAKRAGQTFDVILSRPNPGHVSRYLKTRRHRTAIVAFHSVGRSRLL